MIKHVGPKPVVTARGVDFDESKADRYIYLAPTLNMIEALGPETEISRDGSYDLKSIETIRYSDGQLFEKIKELCMDLDGMMDSARKKTERQIEELQETVERSGSLSVDGKRAWLGNIKLMRDYYLQYIVNETAYRCLLNILADIISKQHIKSIEFPLYQNYGLMFSHLIPLLREHRPPVDAFMEVFDHDGKKYGRFQA